MSVLAKPTNCTGCTACAAACPKECISMVADQDGFFHPDVDTQHCVNCGICSTVCPVLNRVKPEHTPTAYAAYSRDEKMRMESSSGGVFSELARAILHRGGAVCGAIYDEQFRVVHVIAEDENGLARMRGAKYAQSDLRGIFSEIKARLKLGQQVLFSGTPCQVEGLRSYLKGEDRGLICVDFVCHGVPSPMAWEKYIESLSRRRTLRSISLRSKRTGWSRYQYSTKIEYDNRPPLYRKSGEDLYMQLFVGDHINNAACSTCQFKGYARRSDITIGDFWEIWDAVPHMDDNKGTSVVLVQSEQGAKLWKELSEHLVIEAVTLETASEKNGAMLYPAKPAPDRNDTLAKIRDGKLASCKYLFPRSSIKQRIKEKIRLFLK